VRLLRAAPTAASTNMPEEKIDIALKGALEAGLRNIVALRGGACAKSR
jgi:5,10-methylenetetrahydrofolate reductase